MENVGLEPSDSKCMFETPQIYGDLKQDYFSDFYYCAGYESRRTGTRINLGHIYSISAMFIKNLDMPASRIQGPHIYSTFFGNLIQTNIYAIFPTMNQRVFLDLWNNRFRTKNKEYLTYSSLNDLYSANPSIFWLPLLELVIKGKLDRPFHDYMQMIKELKIPIQDAGNYFDFICMWVYPFTFQTEQAEKLNAFFGALVQTGYGNLKENSYIAKNDKIRLSYW
jgi:hypothetical protein